MDMRELCSQCNICHFMPDQVDERAISWYMGKKDNPDEPLVLVIDDAANNVQKLDACHFARNLLRDVEFTYTTTIRCHYDSAIDFPLDLASASCSVWTRHLLANRLLTLSTKRGLRQMGIEEREPGSCFRSKAYGLVLCILPITVISGSATLLDTFRSHTQRMLREAGL